MKPLQAIKNAFAKVADWVREKVDAIVERVAAFFAPAIPRLVPVGSRLSAFAIALVVTCYNVAAQAQYNIVSYDAEDGVTFTPSALTSPIVLAVVAAVSAGATIFVISTGVSWIWRMLSRR